MRYLTGVFLLAAAPSFAQTASVTVNPAAPGAAVTDQILGMNMANWFDPTQSNVAPPMKKAGIKAIRWPGGSGADLFHWATNSECSGGYVDSNASFDNLFADVVKKDKLDVAVTVNYGSNSACNAGGDPAEAAAWVTYAKTHGDKVSHWTVGNEVYGSWEYDLHAVKNDPATYAAAVATGYYPAMKAANAKALVGVVAEPGWSPPWDPIVLSQAKYDFVEYHYYAQSPGQESDAYLVGQAAQAFASNLVALKSDLTAAGHASTPIYVGELGSVYANPGKQSSSITQSLFAGQVLGEMMNAGVSRATWWLAYGGCNDANSGNFGANLYGWQNFGGYMVFSDGTPEYGCSNATPTPLGTLLPTSRAFQLFALVAKEGEHALPAVVGGNASDLRAYALTQGTGTALVLFNVNESSVLPVSIAVTGVAHSSAVTVNSYDKAIYDKSQNNVWAPPVEKTLGAKALPFTLKLAPWSMNVVRISQ
jgi:alpha-N-arabinofuranosidase